VARTGARIYIGYKRTQRRTRNMPAEASSAVWDTRHAQFAEDLYRLATDLKGVYIKTGQFVGTRSDVFPEPYVRSLSRLQDRVPPRPAATVRATIERSLGRPVAELFRRFDDTPIATASLAQVHRAALPSGREVVVKVQHPEVASLIRLDIRNLKMLVAIVARREPAFDYRAIVNELARQVPLELDFVREAEMTARVAANLRHLPGIVVPDVVEGLVSREVLVTGFIEGVRVLGDDGRRAAVSDGAAVAAAVTQAYGHQILVDGLFQADPHPGNILVLPDGRVALLDFGLTKELDDTMRLGFSKLVVASASRDVSAILEAFRALGVQTRNEEPEGILGLMRLLFDARDGGQSFRGQRSQALGRTPVDAIPSDLVLLGRVIGLLRGLCASLGSPLTPMQMLRPFAERALSEAA
jgi:predicted unusual protein kinase regulating ubiquinone biosynthesis (AarF/ABC1/UbiB family)